MGSPAASHAGQTPSDWVVRFTPLARSGDGGRDASTPPSVLDVACGSGRHLAWFARQGFRVTGVDRSPEAIASASALGEAVLADLENGPWPLAGRVFDAVVVTDYLWRPLLPAIAASVAEGGVLIYETFAAGQDTIGRPARPDFLLQPGELLHAFGAFRTVAFEDGFECAAPPPDRPESRRAPRERFVQRIACIRQRASGPVRLPL